MVEIRKNRREESLLKKRREGLQPQQIPSSIHSVVEKKLENLPSMVTGVWSDDNDLQLEATTQFRKLLSIERTPPIEEVIQTGVVSRFVEFLMREDFPQLQFEAAWAISNAISVNHRRKKQYRLVMVSLVLGLQTQKLLALAMAMAGLMFQMPRASKVIENLVKVLLV